MGREDSTGLGATRGPGTTRLGAVAVDAALRLETNAGAADGVVALPLKTENMPVIVPSNTTSPAKQHPTMMNPRIRLKRPENSEGLLTTVAPVFLRLLPDIARLA